MSANVSLLTIFFISLIIPFGTSLTFNYTSFSYDDNISYERAYLDSNRAIQLTSAMSRNRMVGRASYSKPVRLWDRATGNLTDFSTHFIFEIDSENRTAYGDGLAFFLVPQGSRIPNVTEGGSFGLTNDDQPLNSTTNPFVAVEFDIFQNPWDPRREHVGIDINSVRSVSNLTWLSDIRDGQRSEAWISYNSSTWNLSVVFTGISENSTVMQQGLHYNVYLRLYLPEFVTIGFSAATGGLNATFTIYSWEFSSSLEVKANSTDQAPPLGDRRRRSKNTKLGLGLGLGGGGVVLICSLVLVWFIGICRGSKGQVYMVQWVWELYGSGKLLEAADPRLSKAFEKQQMEYLMIIGLWCAHPDENLRPSIRQAIQVLNFEASLPVLPPKMPVPTYLIPSANPPISVQSLTYGSGAYSDESHNQSSSYNYNTNSSQLTTSSGTSSPSAALLNTR
ncbi:hypothetical protein EZV62_019328 [Acer yangbiense]|uniref:Legume lectin domain-containing protein n=1 Tax=Acer yangbiense TaxID=1000413 RepID=A0A5C7HC56_9ROSI|nr:hypothetical protein EZV62_019328 [Acer yangbiense]